MSDSLYKKYASEQYVNQYVDDKIENHSHDASEISGPFVKYEDQSLSDEEKEIARKNIGVEDSISKLRIEKLVILEDKETGLIYSVELINGELKVNKIDPIEVVIVPPNKTSYIEGEYFDPEGMQFIAIYQNDIKRTIINYSFDQNYLTSDTTSKTIYVHGLEGYFNVDITVEKLVPEVHLVDFDYVVEEDGSYTLTGWKSTLNGEPSSRLIIPNNALVNV